MSDIVNVLITVDTETVAGGSLSQDQNNPTAIPNNRVFAVVRSKSVVEGQASGELNIAADTGDILRWRMASLSLNDDSTTVPYKFTVSSGADLVKDLGANIVTVTAPLPNPADPLHPGTQTIKDYHWEAEILNPGKATYQFRFMILDRHGNMLGYCTWDPYITIKS